MGKEDENAPKGEPCCPRGAEIKSQETFKSNCSHLVRQKLLLLASREAGLLFHTFTEEVSWQLQRRHGEWEDRNGGVLDVDSH